MFVPEEAPEIDAEFDLLLTDRSERLGMKDEVIYGNGVNFAAQVESVAEFGSFTNVPARVVA